jgi:hypothetical protein
MLTLKIMKSYLRKVFTLGLILLVFDQFEIHAQEKMGWKEITTVEDLCNSYPEVVRKMFEEFNLDYPGLEGVKLAVENGDLVSACQDLLQYYRESGNAQHLRHVQPNQSTQAVAEADTILNNVFTIQNVKGKVPFGPDGHRDWYYKGPNNDREWAWLSNRHSQINFVLSTYFETGNPKYAEYIDLFLRDFIIKSMPYPGVKSSTSVWRGLEVAARAKVWSRIFYGMIDSPYLSPATCLLMLSSLPDHAHYNRNFHGGNNWLTMEISALATVATNFPEYKNSEEWLDYSIETMIESMKDQVYADGVQTELTSHYHNVSLRNFELFKDICDQAEKPLPDFFNKTIEAMYSYISHAIRPDGNRILNNDGDRGSDRALVLEAAKKFNHPDWEYIATDGASGVKPLQGPSYFYPWAGHLISRSGFDANAHWSFFDIGPWGSGHQHNDKLHLSIAAYGRDLLVDAGRFAYTGEVAKKFRPYARGTQGHNTILIDSNGQSPGPRLATEPLSDNYVRITPEFDYAWGAFDEFMNTSGKCEHNRAVMYVRGKYWIVVDRITTDQPRDIEVLWHWHPDCDVIEAKKNIVATSNPTGNLAVIPVSKQKWGITFIKGQEEPEIQGWYSEEYNKYEPNVATIYSTRIKSNKTFVWLLQPFEQSRISPKVSTVQETEEMIRIQIQEPGGGKSVLTIPFSDSAEANLETN